MEPIKIPPLTEEDKAELRKFFGDVEDVKILDEIKAPKIFLNYGRMRYHDEKIPIAEQYLDECRRKRKLLELELKAEEKKI
jgi:hypothetical protein